MSQTNNPTPKINAEVMRELRTKVLTTLASDLKLKPTQDYPRVYTALMDWPLGTNIISVYGSCTGDASIYSTSTFGVIGGIGHESVRKAAYHFVKVAESHYDDAVLTKKFPYPKPGHIYFYLICFDGVRMIDVVEESLRAGKDKCSDLGNAAQQLITELRMIAEKK
ncbi:MAG TPA: hypothetical protein VFM25_09120 [Verrucomicrobiae bacterium]|nr:hypothetical protein [Verrucomicrobiae bacterium]